MLSKFTRAQTLGLVAAALLLSAAPVQADCATLTVTATAGTISPDWVEVPSDELASTSLSATVDNPPTGSGGSVPCTLDGPNWSWSAISSGAGCTAWVDHPDPSSSSATLYCSFSEGGYWSVTCTATVGYSDTCGNCWSGSNFCNTDPKSVELIDLKVTDGATQTNVTGAENWAAVKKANAKVTVEATVKPDTEDAAAKITWTGGDAVEGTNKKRTVSRANSAKTEVKAKIGMTEKKVVIWIIWAEVTIQIAGDRANDNNAQSFTDNGGNWTADKGGGKALGAIDHDAVAGLTYAYTIGKIQATGKLTPAGIGGVVSKTAWKLKRTKEKKAWDNGGRYTNPADNTTWAAGPSSQAAAGADDTSNAPFSDLDPTSGGSVDTIYDRDAPGCSNVLNGITIYRTSELYQNFTQFVTVTLNAEETCSDNALWSYQARVDGDKAAGARVELNKLDTKHIVIPAAPHYAKR